MDQYIGKMLDNRYEILECIGNGGMAVVYKARDHRLNRLVAALALPGVSHVVNVGDSRCYLIEHEMIRQVTVDHSLVQLLVDRGEITAEEARVHPRKNLITRALGVDSEVDCDLLRIETGPGSRLLLCSDGLTNVLTDQVLLQTSLDEAEPEGLCRSLLRMTLERGAPDNVTVVLAQL